MKSLQIATGIAHWPSDLHEVVRAHTTKEKEYGQVSCRMAAGRSGGPVTADLSIHALKPATAGSSVLAKEADMKSIPLSLMLSACLGVSICAYAQTSGSPAPGTPAANPTSPPATGQNNNPSAIPPPPPTPASPTTNGSMPISPQNPQTQPNPAAPGQVPPVPSTIGTTAPVTAAPGSVSTTNGSGQIFTSLDGGKKGYLNSADVASNKFLAGHFQKCDTNSDGRLTQAEVNLCMQQMPASER
jgi:hypothetical protein